ECPPAGSTASELLSSSSYLPVASLRPVGSQERLAGEPDGHSSALAQFHFLARIGQHDAGAGRTADQGSDTGALLAVDDRAHDGPGARANSDGPGVLLVGIAGGDIERPRADCVLPALEHERVEVEGEAS